MAKNRAEHYRTMLKDIKAEINEDCYQCYTDTIDGSHFTQFADGSALDSADGTYTKEQWERAKRVEGVILCEDTPEREHRWATLCAENNRQLGAKTFN